jgi:hypothetical protein
VGVLAAIGCVASLAIPGAALADTLDQQQPVWSNDARIYSEESLAETITGGLTGGLDRIELPLRTPDSVPTDPLTVEIRDVSASSPGTTVLATGSVAPVAVSSTYAWVPITFAPAVPVVAGTQYAIVAYSPVDMGHDYSWAVEADDQYPAGANFTQTISPPTGTWMLTSFPFDQAFKTYVEVPAPPAGQPPATKKKCKKHKKGKKKHRAASAAKKKCKKKKRK